MLEFELPISLSSVRDMYRWRNLRALCGGSALVGDRRWEPFNLSEGGTIGNPAARASHGNVNEDDFDDCFRHWEHGSMGGRERCYTPISISESPELPEAKANKRNHDEVIDKDVFFVHGFNVSEANARAVGGRDVQAAVVERIRREVRGC